MKNTQGVTLEMMEKHGLAVTKNVKKSISVIDMPYKSYVNKRQAYTNAKKLLVNHTQSTGENLNIENFQPDYLVVGSDWKDKDVVGGHFAKEIVYFNRIEGYSTTSILTNDREQVI